MSDNKEHTQKTEWTDRYWDEGLPKRMLDGKRTRGYAWKMRFEKVRMARNRRRAEKKIIEQQLVD